MRVNVSRWIVFFAAVGFAVASALFPVPAQALPFDEFIKYYDTCGTSRVLVGTEHWACDGSYTATGTQSNYRDERWLACGGSTSYHVYVECGVEVSSLDTCTC